MNFVSKTFLLILRNLFCEKIMDGDSITLLASSCSFWRLCETRHGMIFSLFLINKTMEMEWLANELSAKNSQSSLSGNCNEIRFRYSFRLRKEIENLFEQLNYTIFKCSSGKAFIFFSCRCFSNLAASYDMFRWQNKF